MGDCETLGTRRAALGFGRGREVINNKEGRKKQHEIQINSNKKWNGLLASGSRPAHTAINSEPNIESSCPEALESN